MNQATFNGLHEIEFEEVKICIDDLRLYVQEKRISASMNELRLILALIIHPYQWVSSEELIERLSLSGKNSLHTLVCRVRVLFDQKYIHAFRSVGYSFARRDDDRPKRRIPTLKSFRSDGGGTHV